MANNIEKIFTLLLKFGDSEKQVEKMSKLVQSLNAHFNNVLKTIQEIGKSDGLKKASEVLGVYKLTVDSATRSKKKLVEVGKEENAQSEAAKKYIDDLKAKYGDLIFTKKEIATLTKNYEVLQRAEKGSMEETTAKINILNTAWRKMGDELLKSVKGKQVTAELNKLRESLHQTTMGAGDFSRNIGRYSQGVQAAFAKIGSAWMIVKGAFNTFRGSIKTIMEFEQANANLATVLGKSASGIKDLTNSALELGRTTEYSASQVTQLQTELAKLGFGEAAIQAMQGPVLQFATAVGANLADAAALAGATLRTFDLDAKDTEEMLSVLAVATNKSALSFSYLQTAMAIVSPVARMFGFDVKDTAALLGTLANSGFDASMAATATRNILLHLADANGKLAKALGQPVRTLPELVAGLQSLRDRGVDLAGTLELTDKRSVAAFNTFLNGAVGLQALRGELENTNGELKRIQDERLNTVEGSVKLLTSAWEGLVLSFSNSKGVFKSIVDGLTFLVNGASDLVKGSDDLVTQFDKQIERVADLEGNIRPLISEYTSLWEKTEKNADEQERLKTITQQLAAAYPAAITSVDEYGNAIGISTEKINRFIDAERARLKYVHADAIEKLKEEVLKQQGIIEAAQAQLKLGYKYVGGSISNKTPSTRHEFNSDEIEALQQEIASAKELELGMQTELERLNGNSVEKIIKARQERQAQRDAELQQIAAFRLMSYQELNLWINDKKNADNQYLNAAKQVLAEMPESPIAKRKPSGGESKAAEDKIKAEETYTASRKAQADRIAQYDIQHREAEVQRMADGVDKKIQINELATDKAKEAAEKEYEAEIAKLDKEIEANKGNRDKINEINAEKALLSFAYDQKCTDITAAGADARVGILRDATEEELNEYAKVPGKAFEAELAITENKRREVEERLKLSKKELSGADDKFVQNEAVADATFGTDPKDKERHAARLKNEIELRQAKAQTYMADLAAMQEAGQTESAAYAQTLSNIGLLKQEAENLGKGLNADGSGGGAKGWLMRTFEVTEEEAKQLIQQAWDLASQIGNAMIDAQKQASQRRLKNEKKAINSEYKIHSKLLDDKRDKGLISEKTYQKEMEKLEADKAAKEEEAEKAAFERQKKLSIQQAIMNTAIAVMKIWAETPKFDFGISTGILTALAIAQGAIQIATISSQKYAQGGLISLGDGMGVVKGRSHAQGGHRIYLDGRPIGEIEGDELLAIVNKRDTARIGALSAANSVHGRKFARGGLISPGGYMTSNVGAPAGFAASSMRDAGTSPAQMAEMMNLIREDTRRQVEAINRRIDTLKVVVVAQDVTDTQDNIKKIRVKSSW